MRPLRSVLFLPASNPRAIEKARGVNCDAVVLDLEDAVGPDLKDQAREAAVSAVQAGGFRARTVAIRVNGLETPWGVADLSAAVQAAPDAVVAPKVSSAEGVGAYEAALASAPQALRVWVMIETAAGVLTLPQIAAAGGRLEALLFGQNDLSKELGRRVGPVRTGLHPAMAWTVAAARAAGIAPIDGVFNDVADLDGLAAECREGREFGFDGKCLIHPGQVETANSLFSPSDEDAAWARAVVAAFDDPANAGAGVVRVEGRMAERLHLEQARRILGLSA